MNKILNKYYGIQTYLGNDGIVLLSQSNIHAKYQFPIEVYERLHEINVDGQNFGDAGRLLVHMDSDF